MYGKIALVVVLGTLLALVAAGTVFAQGFDAKVEFLLGASISGADEELGSEMFYSNEYQGEAEPPNAYTSMALISDWGYLENYEVTPIVLNANTSNAPLKLDLGYTVGQTRFGFLWFNVGGTSTGSGSAPGAWHDPDNYYTYSYGIIGLWGLGDYYWYPYGFEPSWYEYVSDPEAGVASTWDPEQGASLWDASQELSLNSVYLTVEHPVLKSERGNLVLIGGFHQTNWSESLMQRLSMVDHWSDTYVFAVLYPLPNTASQHALLSRFVATYPVLILAPVTMKNRATPDRHNAIK